VSNYARVESALFVLLRAWAGTSYQASKAIFSGTRAEAATQLIRRLHEAEDVPMFDWLSEAFAQLAHITKLRNDLVHYGTEPGYGSDFVSNSRVAHVPSKLREYSVSAQLIGAAAKDLREIELRLLIAYKDRTSVTPADEFLCTVKLKPWRYKPSQPDQLQKASQVPRRTR
jgi:hypothetical protein